MFSSTQCLPRLIVRYVSLPLGSSAPVLVACSRAVSVCDLRAVRVVERVVQPSSIRSMPGTDTARSEAQCFRGSTVSGRGCMYQCREEVEGSEDRLRGHQNKNADSYHVLSLKPCKKLKSNVPCHNLEDYTSTASLLAKVIVALQIRLSMPHCPIEGLEITPDIIACRTCTVIDGRCSKPLVLQSRLASSAAPMLHHIFRHDGRARTERCPAESVVVEQVAVPGPVTPSSPCAMPVNAADIVRRLHSGQVEGVRSAIGPASRHFMTLPGR